MPGIAARVNGRLPSPHLAAYFTYPKYGPVVLLLSAVINTVYTLIAACCALSTAVVHAQERPDSLAQADEALVPEVPVGFESADVALTLTDTLLHFDHDLTTALAQHAGSFSYDFGAFGWPSGWSYLGASPSHAALYWHGIPFNDPHTGRPRYDLLPTALLRAPGVAVGARSMPVAVFTRLRSFDATRPLTELHYQAGDNGLQRVTALHAQEAAPRFLGRPRMVQWLFAYAGAAATGEYPGSKLERMRQLLLQSRYRQGMWSLEVMYLHNQRRLGAHGGVVPFADYETVYNRLIAPTRGERSVRRDLRHDVSATLQLRTLEAPLTLQAWQTYARMRYTVSANVTTETASSRWGLRARQSSRLGEHRLRMLAEGYVQDSDVHVHAALRDSLRVRAFTLVGEAGSTMAEGTALASASAEVSYGRLLYATAYSVGIAPSRATTQGFGHYVATLPEAPVGRVEQVRLGGRIIWRALEVDAFVFAGQERNLPDFYGQRSDSMAVRVHPGTVRLSGLAVDVGLRRSAPRGFYAHAQALLASGADDAPAARKQALPRLSGQGRLGARYRLFTGDLRLDLSVRTRLWSAMTSRTLHAPTGLLVLAEDPTLFPEGGRLPASATIDVVAEAGLRTAVLFVAYENVTSGTQLMAGNQVVPVYPLPATRLRFGVFWPIVN